MTIHSLQVSKIPARHPAEWQRRRVVAGGLAGAAVALVVLAMVLAYRGRALLRPQPFADRAVAALRSSAVQEDVADHLTSAIIQTGNGDLVSIRPLVRSLAGAIVGGSAFAALFRRGILNTHAAVIEHDGGVVRVTLADAGVLVQGALERFAPDAARTIGAERVSRLLTLHPSGSALWVARAARHVYSIAWILAVLGVLAAVGAVSISPDRRRTAQQLGIGLAVGALAIVLVLAVGRAWAEHRAPAGRSAVVGAVWASFLGGLRAQALWVAAAGAICAAAASGRLRLAGVDARLMRGWRLLTRAPATPRRRVARDVALIVGGLAIVLQPALALTVAAQAGGLYILYRGVEALLIETARTPRRAAQPAPARRRRWRRLIPVALAIAALGGAFALIGTGAADQAPAVTPLTCNGHIALCDRRLNEVALAATHNSMASVTIPTWLFGQQDGTIEEQLEYGIHGLLIDTYYGEAVPGGVRTDLARVPKREIAERELGAPAVEAALRIRSRLGHQGKGKPGYFSATASASSEQCPWPRRSPICARSWCPIRGRS